MSELSEVGSLLEGFRNPESTVKIVEGVVTQHPMLVASHNFVEAERALADARARYDSFTAMVDEAKADVIAKSKEFDDHKAHLAALLRE